MIEITSPAPFSSGSSDMLKIFLGGSIEMDMAEHWQDRIIKDLTDENMLE